MTSENLAQFFKKDVFAARSGIELLEISPGKARARMQVSAHHHNGLGTAHGGALFTLADFAFAAASNSHGSVAVAVNASINFMKAVKEGTLIAEAREASANPRLGTYTVEIRDELGDLVALFQGLAYRKKDPLPLS